MTITYKGHTITKTEQTGSRGDGAIRNLYQIEGEHAASGFAALKASLFTLRECREYISNSIDMAGVV